MRAAIAGAFVLAVILPGAVAKAAEPSTGVALGALAAPSERAPQPPVRTDAGRLDSGLSIVAAAPNARAASARADAAGITFERGEVRVVVEGEPGRVAEALHAAGASGLAPSPQGYEASVAPVDLAEIAAAPGVRFVSAAARPYALSVSGEEVAAIHAQAWHTAGVTGVGAKVAIIDLGFGGLAAAQSAGDVPVSVTTADYCSGQFSTATSHGTAVTEVVHEIAPDAQLLLACVDSPANLAAAETWAIAQGAKIINHSVGWFNTARGDGQGGAGTPDGVVADAAAHGVFWVNAAGNSAQQHWSGAFSDVNADAFEDFASNDEGQSVFVPAGSQFCAFMRWDEWSGVSPDDYDLFVVDSAANTLVASSTGDQTTGAPPKEAACYTPSSSKILYVAIQRYRGTGAPRIDLFTLGGSDAQYQVAAGSINDPAAAPGALAVGAVCWQTGEGEAFSSQGPTIDGRVKPDISATDRMSSGVYGPFDSCTGSSGFAGTSAASPSVAGMAALVSQLYPSAGVAQLRDYLVSHALDKGPAGTDSRYGAGEALLPSALSIPQNVVAPAAAGMPTPGNTLTAGNGTWAGDGELLYSVLWSRCDAAGANCATVGLGSTFGVTATDLGSRLRMSVTAVSAIGSTTASGLTRVITTTAPPLNVGAPTIVGSAVVGLTLTAGEGTWDSPGTTTYTYDWQSCDSAALCTAVGTARTYVVAGTDLGRQLQVAVTAANADGQSTATSALSASVQAAPPSGGGGGGGGGGCGGGGGGGGGGSVPNLGVTIAAKTTALAPGDADELTIYIANTGDAGSLQTHLAVNLPAGITLLGDPYFERGSGCKGTSAIDCFLDYIPDGGSTKVVLEVRANAAGKQTVTGTASADRDSDPKNNSFSLDLQVGTSTPTTPPPPPTPKPAPHGRTLTGTSRPDRLVGTPYADVLVGNGGNDVLLGGKGNDRLFGNAGRDVLDAGPGLDRVDAGAGNDMVRTRDGSIDVVLCGSGVDTVVADKRDKLTGCEHVRRF